MDERLAEYVQAHWDALVDRARERCDGASEAEAEELVLSALSRVAMRWRFRASTGSPDAAVERQLARLCHQRGQEQAGAPTSFMVMEVGAAGSLAAADGDDLPPQPGRPGLAADEAISALTRRVSRARRSRLLIAGVAVVAVVAVAVSVAGTGAGKHIGEGTAAQGNPRHPVPIPLLQFPKAPADFANGVTFGGGWIWTIESRPTKVGSRAYVVQRNPVTGKINARYRVPQADDHIAYGFGKAWTWHNGDDFPNTAIATVGTTGDVGSERWTPSVAIQDMTFTSGFAWMTEPKANFVVTFRDGVLGANGGAPLTGARFVIPLSPHSVLVAGSTGTLHELPSGQFVYLGAKPPSLLASAPAYGIWIAHGRRLTYQTRIDEPPALRLDLPLSVGAVIGDPDHGVYVELHSENPRHYDPYLVYYSPAALRSPHPQPTARLDGLVQAEGMVANPAGGVVFVTNDGAVDAWHPDASPGRGFSGDRADHAGITSSTRRTLPRGGFA